MSKYSPEIEEVHQEFMTYSKKLVTLAMNGPTLETSKVIEKAERLKSLGFRCANQIEEASKEKQKIDNAEEVFKWVKEYAIKYPTLKFITEQGIKEICAKYNLVFGEVSLYKGFVPEKNLKELEAIKIKDEDRIIITPQSILNERDRLYRHIATFYMYESLTDEIGKERKKAELLDKEIEEGKHKQALPYKIAAPIKDMAVTKKHVVRNGYSIEEKIEVPDPVVVCPVHGGYLILTAWGDEASDPLVVNEKMN